jgi:hypothetical protein
MRSIVNSWIADMKYGLKETMACQGMTEAIWTARSQPEKKWNLSWNNGRSLMKKPQWYRSED